MIEAIRPGVTATRAKVALFDFDGTLSLIRSGWVEVMVPMMVEILAATKSGESEAQLTEVVTEFVGRLTGKHCTGHEVDRDGTWPPVRKNGFEHVRKRE